MNPLDVIILCTLGIALFVGWRKGLVAMLFSLAGLVGGIWVAYAWGDSAAAWAGHADSGIARGAAFALLLAAVCIAAHFAGRLVAAACRSVGLGALDSLGGILLALAEGALLLGLLGTAADYVAPGLIGEKMRRESKCVPWVEKACEIVFPTLRRCVDEVLPDASPAAENSETHAC